MADDTRPRTALAKRPLPEGFNNLNDLLELAKILYLGGCTPEGVSRPETLIPMILMGHSLGMPLMASVNSIMPPVNGRFGLFGDSGLALARASGELAKFSERMEGQGDDRKAVCDIQRKGQEAKSFEYPLTLGRMLRSYKKQHEKKMGPWFEDPDNMLRFRARWRALRSEFTDILFGFSGAEELEDDETTPQQRPEAVTVAVTTARDPRDMSVETPPQFDPSPDGRVTGQQLAEIKRLKTEWEKQYDIEPAASAAKWAEILAPCNVASARELSYDAANNFIRQIGYRFDPFTYPPPPEPTSATTAAAETSMTTTPSNT